MLLRSFVNIKPYAVDDININAYKHVRIFSMPQTVCEYFSSSILLIVAVNI
jgi:hypothetical protein